MSLFFIPSLRSFSSLIGFKTAQKIRNHVLRRPAAFTAGLVYGATKENVYVRDVRMSQGMGPKTLGQLLTGPGFQRDLGERVWGLIHGIGTLCIPSKISYSDLILSPEICLKSFCSSDVSRSSFVFLRREILTPKSLR